MTTSPVSAPVPVEITPAIAPVGTSHVVVVRRLLLLFYAGFAIGLFAVQGVPFDREQVLLWICGALLVACIGRPVGEIAHLVRDWVPFGLVLVAYDYTRGLADTLGMPIREGEMIAIDRAIGVGEVPTVWLQDRLYDAASVHWYDVMTTLVYLSHFLVVYVVAGVLWARNRPRWAAFVRRYLTLTFAGLATYVLLPGTPPWLAARHGEIDPVVRASGKGWSALGLDSAASLVDKGQAIFNQVAALPSLHAAFAALVCAYFWSSARWPTRIVLAAYPLAMGFGLVYAGEHYVADVLMGWLYVAVVMFAVARAERWWRQRRHDADRTVASAASA